MKKLSLYLRNSRHKKSQRQKTWCVTALRLFLFFGISLLALSVNTYSLAADDSDDVEESDGDQDAGESKEVPEEKVADQAEDADEDDPLEDLEKIIGAKETDSEKSPTQAAGDEKLLEDDGELAKDVPPTEPKAAERASRELAEGEPDLEKDLRGDENQAEVAPTAPVIGAVTEPPANLKSGPVPRVSSTKARNQISNLEFKMDGEKSRIVVTFREAPEFREEKNDTIKQRVYFFENTETPNRLQRAYDTSEFPSPVNIFTLLQMPGGDRPLSKLIVQLRESKGPQVTSTANAIYIDFPPPDQKFEPKIVIGEENGEAVEENVYASGKTFQGKRIQRLEIKNSDAQDVLRLIAKTSGFNIVVGDDVTGKVGTLSLENIPWDQAFALVLQSKKLGYIKQGNVIRVGTLASLKAEKEESLANEQSRIKAEPLKTVLIPVSYAKAADVAPRAKNFLTDRGTIDTDVRTNTVIIKDIDKTITRVQKLIAALDTQPPRVSVTARVVEMLTSFSRQIGFGQHTIAANLSGINLSQAVSLTDKAGAWTTTLSVPRWSNLQSIFSMGESENKVKILAAPSVSVVANQTGTVSQSNSFFVPVTEIANGVAVATVRQFTASLNMDVTPIVAGDGSIFMTINVRNEIPRGEGTTRTVDSRTLSTQVLLENGDTTVIGGIFNNTVNTTRTGVPFFSSIPILGLLFNLHTQDDIRNEIFIFLTAKILNPEESFKRNF